MKLSEIISKLSEKKDLLGDIDINVHETSNGVICKVNDVYITQYPTISESIFVLHFSVIDSENKKDIERKRLFEEKMEAIKIMNSIVDEFRSIDSDKEKLLKISDLDDNVRAKLFKHFKFNDDKDFLFYIKKR